jgi:hypothetical protein
MPMVGTHFGQDTYIYCGFAGASWRSDRWITKCNQSNRMSDMSLRVCVGVFENDTHHL